MTALALRRTVALSRAHGFLALVLCLFVGLSIEYATGKVRDNRSAVLRWQDQILRMEAGIDPYENFNYPNPPIMAVLLTPLAHLPPAAFALGWFYLKVAMTLLCFRWVIRLLNSRAQPFPRWASNLAILLSLPPIINDLTHGNINLFILFTIVGSLYSFHRNRNVLSGLLLALGIACKVTPALFLVYFVWKRAWKTLAGAVLGLGLFLWLVPGLVFGWQRNHELLKSWSEQMLAPFLVQGKVTSEHSNQSLPGLASRLLTHSPSFSTWDENWQPVPAQWHNVLDLDPAWTGWIVKACWIGFCLLVVLSCRTPLDQRRSWRMAAEFGIIVLGMLLFSERTWKHHCVTFLLPIAVICHRLGSEPLSRRMRGLLIAILTFVVLLMASTSTDLFDKRAPFLAEIRFAKLAQVYGAYIWAYCLLLAGMVLLLRGEAAEVIAADDSIDPADQVRHRAGGQEETRNPAAPFHRPGCPNC
jgi:hypothetical protein